MSQQEAPTAGTIREGHNVLTDFFAQDQYKVLDPDAVMLDDISGAAPKVPVVELRSLLGCFMFSGDDVFKKVGVLSGGERNRYAMAKMLVSPANILLLDEPTNHLDLRAKDVLLDAIRNFTGTVLFVSHDRYFIDGLATRVFEVEDRRLHIYPGNYEDYLWRKQGGPEKTAASLATSLKPAVSSNSVPPSKSAHPSSSVILSEVPELVEGTQSKDPEEAVVPRLPTAFSLKFQSSASTPSSSNNSKTVSTTQKKRSRASNPPLPPSKPASAPSPPPSNPKKTPPTSNPSAQNELPS